MAKLVVGNRTTSGSDHRPIVRSIIPSDGRSYDQSWCRVTDGTINRGVRRPIAQSIVASGDGSHDQTWNLRPIVRLVVPPVAKLCDKSGQFASSRTTARDVVGRVAPQIVRWHDKLHDQSSSPKSRVIREHSQLVVQPRTTGGTIT